jgi:uncharacterized membrane protein
MNRIVPKPRTALRWLAAIVFVAAGINHFIEPAFYRRIVPPGFPSPSALVAISGIFEIMGGLGLLVRPLRRIAGWGLIALLIAVFPANIYMAVDPQRSADSTIPMWILWIRLPVQGVIIAWVWWVALRRDREQTC